MLQALDMAEKVDSFAHSLPLYACFNPYFPDEGDLAAEKQRLEQKLRHSGSLVKGIYLQVDHLPAPLCLRHALSCSTSKGSALKDVPGNRRAPVFKGLQILPASS